MLTLRDLAKLDFFGRCWDEGQPPGAGDGKTGDTSSGGKRADGETLYTKEQLQAEVQKAINARFGKEKGTAERKASQAAEAAVQAFREQHGLDDETLDKVKSQQSAFDKLARESAAKDKRIELLEKSNGELVSRDKSRRVTETMDTAIAAFSKKHNLRLIDDAKQDVLASLRPRFRAEDDGSMSILGDDGNPLSVEPGDWIAEQLQSRKYALEPTVSGGAGSRPRGQAGGGDKKRDLSTSQGAGDLYAEMIKGD